MLGGIQNWSWSKKGVIKDVLHACCGFFWFCGVVVLQFCRLGEYQVFFKE